MSVSDDDGGIRQRLHSWKEIAGYLGVHVRTAQRWEKHAGLPIYRQGSDEGRPIADAIELDRWLEKGSLRAREAGVQQTSRYRWLFVLVPIVAVTLLLVYFQIPGPVLPAFCEISGSTLRVYDSEGRLIWSQMVEGLQTDTIWDWPSRLPERYLIADLEDDGVPEIILNVMPDGRNERSGRLVCFEHTGTVRWEFTLGKEIVFNNRRINSKYVGRVLRLVKGNEGKRYLLVVADHYKWFPSQTSLLDPPTGRLLDEYWHPGHMFTDLVVDLDHDGSDEVLLGGTNNPGVGLGHAAVVALDIPFDPPVIRDDSPISALTQGRESRYLLFPNTDLLQARLAVPLISEIVKEPGDRILVTVHASPSSNLFYQLGYDLELISFRLSDTFILDHEELFRRAALDHSFSQAEKECLQVIREFPTAPDGNSTSAGTSWPCDAPPQ